MVYCIVRKYVSMDTELRKIIVKLPHSLHSPVGGLNKPQVLQQACHTAPRARALAPEASSDTAYTFSRTKTYKPLRHKHLTTCTQLRTSDQRSHCRDNKNNKSFRHVGGGTISFRRQGRSQRLKMPRRVEVGVSA